jgi:Protein of unknown function (DUF2971)
MTVSAMNEAQFAPSGSWKEEFMSCLTVPVFTDMRRKEAIELRDRNKPDSLYRYRSLENEREFKNIERQQVWLSSPFCFNDPFDSSFSILHREFRLTESAQRENIARLSQIVGDKLSESEIEELAKFLDNSDERFTSLFQKAFPEEQPESANAMLAIRPIVEAYRSKHVQELNQFVKQNISVCCFCEARDSTLMWSHYANQHHGCCVEFDVRRLFVPDGIGFLFPVVYKDKLFDVTRYFSATAAGGGNNLAAMIAACHKDKAWAYEQEWRIVLLSAYPEGQNSLSIPVKSISIGVRTGRTDQERLFEIARKLRVPLYRAVQSLTEAKVLFEPVNELA